MNQLQLLIEKTIIFTSSKLKILDPKPFTKKQVEYKSWKTNITNKIKINNKKYINDKQRQTYIFNYLSNEEQSMAKVIVLA